MGRLKHNSLRFRPKDSTPHDPISDLPKEIICLSDQSEMVLVSAGRFKMGTSEEEWSHFARVMEPLVPEGIASASFIDRQRFLSEMPQRHVHLDAFYIGKYEVTNEMYLKFCLESGHRRPLHWSNETLEGMPFGLEYHPVTYVDWHDAWSYARWAGRRLPTEAEWEKAARGTDGRLYPWGDRFDHLKANYTQVYYADNLESEDLLSELREHPRTRVARVDSYPEGASPYGAMDMVGNVWEWVNDWFSIDYYSEGPLIDPQGPPDGECRVIRGGASDYDPDTLRCAHRGIAEPAQREWSIGFRCALTVDEQLAQLLREEHS
jgi:formylglycine-generating enzyme required for sulfatase activity